MADGGSSDDITDRSKDPKLKAKSNDPFNAVKARSFEIMVEGIGQYGPGLRLPSYHDLRVSLLEKAKKKTEEEKEKHVESWREFGCTLMSDGWTDRRGRHLINFLVNSPKGTYFMGSVDASSQSQDKNLLTELFDKQIEKIGPEYVVQIVTDNASNYKAAGHELMKKRPTLFWTPCAAHCLDLMLDDIGNLKQFKSTIAMAKRITTFIYRHGWLLDAMRNHTQGRDLVRAGVTRFATSFLTLQSLWKYKDNLRSLFIGDYWRTSKLSKTGVGIKICETVMCLSFWNTVQDCIRASQPLLIVLRIVDGDEKPAMLDIYAAIEEAKKKIKSHFDNKQKLYKKVIDIVDRRWESQMEQQLYGVAFFLNPGRYFKIKVENSDLAYKLRDAFNDVLLKMVPDSDLLDKISNLADFYDASRGNFAKEMAIRQRESKNPIDWWNVFGAHAIDLAKFAKRILGLCCSASGCERNWSTFENIHTKKRNRLEHQRLNDLVFIQYNRRIKARFQLRCELGKNFDVLSLDEFDWGNEWIVPEQDLVHPEDDLTWGDVDRAVGASSRAVVGCNLPRRAHGSLTYTRRVGSTSRSRLADVDGSDSDVEGTAEEEQDFLNDDEGVDDDYGKRAPTTSESTTSNERGRDDDFLLDDFV